MNFSDSLLYLSRELKFERGIVGIMFLIGLTTAIGCAFASVVDESPYPILGTIPISNKHSVFKFCC